MRNDRGNAFSQLRRSRTEGPERPRDIAQDFRDQIKLGENIAGSAPTPFRDRSWIRTWALTAAIGNLLLFVIFVLYEVAERLWLVYRFSVDDLFAFHIWRGVGASVVIGSWSFYNIWRTRQRYDDAFARAYRALDSQMRERSEALLRAQEFTERVFDALRDRLVVLDREGVVLKANRVAVEACGDLLGRTCGGLNGACSPGQSCTAMDALREGRPRQVQRTDPTSGRTFLVDAIPVPARGAEDELVIEVARDITDGKQMEVQLRSQEKLAAVGVLAAGIAHDIANPLASMSSELEMMESETDLGRLHEAVGVVRSHVARISRTLRDMSDFARRRGDERTAVSVEVAIEDALRMVRHDPRGRRIRIAVDSAAELPRVHMVEDHLVMVLVNLLINAFDAMPDGGELAIKAQEIAGHVRVAVTDTGVGMSEDVLRRCMEPMFTTKRGGKGTGLGLSISSDVVRAAGGHMDVESRPGAGTTVHITLPAMAAA